MSLRARVLAGVALVAVVLGVVMVVITKTTEANLLRQVDAQLASAVEPVRGYDVGDRRPPSGGTDGNDGPRRLSSLYVGYVDGDAVQTAVAPNLSGDDTPLPVISAGQAVAAARSDETFTVGSEGSDLRYRVRAHVDDHADVVTVLALPIDSVDNALTGLVTVETLGAGVIVVVLGFVAFRSPPPT